MTGKTWLFTAVWVSLVKERTPVRPPRASCIPCAEPAPSVLSHILQTGTQGSLSLHSTHLYGPAYQTGQGLRYCPLPVLCFIYMSSTDTHRPAARVSILQCPPPAPNSRAQWWEPMGTSCTCRWYPRDVGGETKDSLSTYGQERSRRFPLPLGRRQRNLCSLEMGRKELWVLTLTYRNVNKISPGVRESPVSGLLWPSAISHLFGHINTQGDHTPILLAPVDLILCVCVCVRTCMHLGGVLQGQPDYWPSHRSVTGRACPLHSPMPVPAMQVESMLSCFLQTLDISPNIFTGLTGPSTHVHCREWNNDSKWHGLLPVSQHNSSGSVYSISVELQNSSKK